jgi:hypothetical protein
VAAILRICCWRQNSRAASCSWQQETSWGEPGTVCRMAMPEHQIGSNVRKPLVASLSSSRSHCMSLQSWQFHKWQTRSV